MKARCRSAIVIVIGALLLLAPALLNRAPFVFYDTTHYLETGQSIWAAAHIKFARLARNETKSSPDKTLGTPASATAFKGGGHHESMAYVGGRSPYYSVVLVFVVGVLGLWGAVFLQGIVGSYLAWRAVALGVDAFDQRTLYFFVLLGLLTLASTLPYFVGYTMPDVFAGYALAALALLAVPPHLLGLMDRITIGLIAAFATLAHASNLVLAGLGVLFALIVLHWSGLNWRIALNRMRWAGACFGVALLGAPIFALSCQLLLGDTPRSPPYLLARVLADGPGRLYLAAACHSLQAYEICTFRDKRLDNHNDILWSTESDKSVFQAADFASKLRLQSEEKRFVAAAVAHYPRVALTAAARNASNQLTTFAVAGEIGATRVSWETMLGAAIPSATEQVTGSRSFRGAFPFYVTDPLQILGVALGFCWLAIFVFGKSNRAVWHRGPPRDDYEAEHRKIVGLVLALFVILIVNAVVCGVLSGPTPRYQGRLTWLVPGLAIYLELCFFGLLRTTGADGWRSAPSSP